MRLDTRCPEPTFPERRYAQTLRFFPPTSTFSGQGIVYPVMSPDWKYRALPTHYGALVVYSRENVLLRELPMPKGTLKLLTFSMDSGLFVAMSSVQFTVWDIVTKEMWQVAHDGEGLMNKEAVTSIYVSCNPATLYAATSNSRICIWDLSTGVSIKQYQGRPGTRYQTQFPAVAVAKSRRPRSWCTQIDFSSEAGVYRVRRRDLMKTKNQAGPWHRGDVS